MKKPWDFGLKSWDLHKSCKMKKIQHYPGPWQDPNFRGGGVGICHPCLTLTTSLQWSLQCTDEILFNSLPVQSLGGGGRHLPSLSDAIYGPAITTNKVQPTYHCTLWLPSCSLWIVFHHCFVPLSWARITKISLPRPRARPFICTASASPHKLQNQ